VGMVIREDSETITVQRAGGFPDSKLKRSDLLERRPQASSPMPLGLLNSLSKRTDFRSAGVSRDWRQDGAHIHSH